MTDVEMCSVLGNLLDNAIEACEKLPCDKRFLRVYIDKFKGQFYLSVQNSSPSIQRDKGIFALQRQALTVLDCFVSTVLQRSMADMSTVSMKKECLQRSYYYH